MKKYFNDTKLFKPPFHWNERKFVRNSNVLIKE